MKSPENMSLPELLKVEKQIALALPRAKQREREALVKEMAAVAAAHGFTVRELLGKPGART